MGEGGEDNVLPYILVLISYFLKKEYFSRGEGILVQTHRQGTFYPTNIPLNKIRYRAALLIYNTK